MGDLRYAKFVNEQKLQQKLAEPKLNFDPYALQASPESLSQEGVPVRAALLIGVQFAKLAARIEALEKQAGPPHLRKQEKR